MRLYVICGHGAGDPGAVGGGYTEAERVRALGAAIKARGGDSVVLLDTSRNWYADKGINSLAVPKGDALVELHMDSAGATARGGHVVIKAGAGGADAYDLALAERIAEIFPGRSSAIVERSDLANANRAAERGINYRLVENGFISNDEDLAIFNERLNDIADAYLEAFGIIGNEEDEVTDADIEKVAALAAEKVWNYVLNGVMARDRLIGTDAAANAAREQLTRTDDPTGRGVEMNLYEHAKHMAAKEASIDEKVDAIARAVGAVTEG